MGGRPDELEGIARALDLLAMLRRHDPRFMLALPSDPADKGRTTPFPPGFGAGVDDGLLRSGKMAFEQWAQVAGFAIVPADSAQPFGPAQRAGELGAIVAALPVEGGPSDLESLAEGLAAQRDGIAATQPDDDGSAAVVAALIGLVSPEVASNGAR
jgi:hypothetical protein